MSADFNTCTISHSYIREDAKTDSSSQAETRNSNLNGTVEYLDKPAGWGFLFEYFSPWSKLSRAARCVREAKCSRNWRRYTALLRTVPVLYNCVRHTDPLNEHLFQNIAYDGVRKRRYLSLEVHVIASASDLRRQHKGEVKNRGYFRLGTEH